MAATITDALAALQGYLGRPLAAQQAAPAVAGPDQLQALAAAALAQGWTVRPPIAGTASTTLAVTAPNGTTATWTWDATTRQITSRTGLAANPSFLAVAAPFFAALAVTDPLAGAVAAPPPPSPAPAAQPQPAPAPAPAVPGQPVDVGPSLGSGCVRMAVQPAPGGPVTSLAQADLGGGGWVRVVLVNVMPWLPSGSWTWINVDPGAADPPNVAQAGFVQVPAGASAITEQGTNRVLYACPLAAPAAQPAAPAPAAPAPAVAAPAPAVAPAPAPPPALSDTLPQPISISCDLPAGATGMVPPGSEAWCAKVADFVDAWSRASSAIWDFFDGILDRQALQKYLDGYEKQGSVTYPPGYVMDAVVWVVRKLIEIGSPVLDRLRDAVRCARIWAAKTFSACNVAALMSLIAARTFLDTLKDIEWGTDAGVWATAITKLDFPPLTKLIDYLIEYVCPQEMPTPEDALEALYRGYISEQLARCIWGCHGRDWDSWSPYRLARSEKIGPAEAIQYVRRHGGDSNSEQSWLRKLGWADQAQIDAFQELYWELPSIGDHLEWLRKNVFDDHYVRDFNLLDGFGTAEDIAEVGYHDYQPNAQFTTNANFWGKFGADLTALGMKKEYAALHYAAHWLMPSLSQLFEMTQRLRDGAVDPAIVFTTQDLYRVMQEQDIGTYFRGRLEAISHPPPNLTLVLQMYQVGRISEDGLMARLLDLGYSESDAEDIALARQIQVRQLRASAGRGWAPISIANGFLSGTLSAADVQSKMADIGYSALEAQALMDRARSDQTARGVRAERTALQRRTIRTATAAYQCGALDQVAYVSQVRAAGVDRETAQAMADDVEASLTVALCAARVKAVRGQVVRGQVSLEDGLASLASAGIAPDRVNYYRDLWSTTLVMQGGAQAASRLLRYVREGLMDAATATVRLTNLGWGQADILLAMQEVGAQMAAAAAKQAAAAQHSSERAQKLAAQQIKQAQAAAAKARGWLKTMASPARMQKWLKEGLMSETDVRERMLALEYDPADVDRYIDEAKLPKKGAKGAKGTGGTAAQGAGGGAASGPAAGAGGGGGTGPGSTGVPPGPPV